MTPKERWRAVLEGRRPDRVPCDYWGTSEVTGRLLRDLGCPTERALWERLGVDMCIHLAPRHPDVRNHVWHVPSMFELWRVETRTVKYGGGIGEYTEDLRHPLADAESVADIDAFDWPDPGAFDVEGLRRECAEWRDYPLWVMTSEPFYLYCRLRGMERALEDLVAAPQIAGAIFTRIFRFDYALTGRVLEATRGYADLICCAEDLGTQESLLMSLATFRKFLKPNMARLIELAHSYGVYVFHHDDGAMRPVIPDLIEIGVDVLNPIQWRCRGMDRDRLARDYGKALIFHGGIDNQQTLPFGTPDEVAQQVRENLAIFGGGRGYIVAPCHNIQANTPTENILALYRAASQASA